MHFGLVSESFSENCLLNEASSKPGRFYTWQVWSKLLPAGKVAVLLLNTGVDTTAVNVTFEELKAKYPSSLSCAQQQAAGGLMSCCCCC